MLFLGTYASQTTAAAPAPAAYYPNPTNKLDNTRDFSSWAIRTSQPVKDAAVARQDGTLGAWRLRDIGDKNQDIYRLGPMTPVQTDRAYPSFWIKKVSPAGLLHFGNPYNTSAYGDYTVDFSKLGSDWTFITETHPAVTKIVTYIYNYGYQIWADASSPTLLSFYMDHVENSSAPHTYVQA